MYPIVEITGEELQNLLNALQERRSETHTLRVAIDDGGAKFKINQGMW